MLRRLMPSSRHARAFSGVISPGLASRVISCFSPFAFRLIVSNIVCKCSTCSVLGVPPPIYIVDMGYWLLDMGRRSCISASNASTYCVCFSIWVVEKKSQYLQRLLQNGIWIYIPAKGIYDLTVDHLLFLFFAPKMLHPFCHFLLLWTALGMPKLGTLQSIGHKLLFDKVIGKIMGIEVVMSIT